MYSQRIKERLSGAGLPSSPGSSYPHSAASTPQDTSLPHDLPPRHDMTSAIQNVSQTWRLRPEQEYTQAVREQFYYEQVGGQTDRWVERQTGGLTDTQVGRQTGRCVDRQTYEWTGRLFYRQADNSGRLTGRQAI